MKTKRSMKGRVCCVCKSSICKGDQYAKKSITLGKSASWTADNRPTKDIPAEVWQPYRVTVSICAACAEEAKR